jgi:hypothetical protein
VLIYCKTLWEPAGQVPFFCNGLERTDLQLVFVCEREVPLSTYHQAMRLIPHGVEAVIAVGDQPMLGVQ